MDFIEQKAWDKCLRLWDYIEDLKTDCEDIARIKERACLELGFPDILYGCPMCQTYMIRPQFWATRCDNCPISLDNKGTAFACIHSTAFGDLESFGSLESLGDLESLNEFYKNTGKKSFKVLVKEFNDYLKDLAKRRGYIHRSDQNER